MDRDRVLGQSPSALVLSVLYRQKSVCFADRMEGTGYLETGDRTSTEYC